MKKEKSLDDYISEDDDDGCNESKMMMAGGGWWWLLYPAGPLYCYWPTLITLRPTLNDTGDIHQKVLELTLGYIIYDSSDSE